MPGRRAPEHVRREQILDAAYEVARRGGLAELTLRSVAKEAGISHGLLVFYFTRKAEVVGGLLDRVLTTTDMLHATDRSAAREASGLSHGSAPEIGELLRQAITTIARDSTGMRLFLEYWTLGARDAVVRARVDAALERFRAEFRRAAEALLASAATAGSDRPPTILTPEALATVAVSLVHGYVVQSASDAAPLDADAYLAAVEELFSLLG